MTVQIRAAIDLDILPLMTLAGEYTNEAVRWANLGFDPVRSTYMASLAIADPFQQIFIAYKGTVIHGFMWVAVAQPVWSRDYIGHDLFLFVPSEHRNLHTAKKLVSAFETWAKDLGAKAIHAGANSGVFGDKPACALYRYLGYTEGGNNFYKQI